MSRETVKTHTAHILAELHLANRTEPAAVVARRSP